MDPTQSALALAHSPAPPRQALRRLPGRAPSRPGEGFSPLPASNRRVVPRCPRSGGAARRPSSVTVAVVTRRRRRLGRVLARPSGAGTGPPGHASCRRRRMLTASRGGRDVAIRHRGLVSGDRARCGVRSRQRISTASRSSSQQRHRQSTGKWPRRRTREACSSTPWTTSRAPAHMPAQWSAARASRWRSRPMARRRRWLD